MKSVATEGSVHDVCAIADGIRDNRGFPSINLLKINQAALNSAAVSAKEFFNIAGCKLVKKTRCR